MTRRNGHSESRKPDYRIMAMEKDTGVRGEIGAAWINDAGTNKEHIGIKFNPFIEHIPAGDDYTISLFPVEREHEDGLTERELDRLYENEGRRRRA